MKVVAKDDCFMPFVAVEMASRNQPFEWLAHEEKVHSQILCDALDGLVLDSAVVVPLITDQYALPFQVELRSLAVGGADLVAIGSFSDLTVRPYRHRQDGWRFFELAYKMPDKTRLVELFEREGFIEPELSMRNSLRLFDRYLELSPGAQKLWINYPYVSGDVLAWDSPVASMNDEAMRERFERFTALSHEVLEPTGVAIMDIPGGIVRSRDGVNPWHYNDEVYGYAADFITEMMR